MTRPKQVVTNDDVHDPAGAFNLVTGVQMPVIAKQHDADFVLIHVERNAENVSGKLYQFLKAYTGKAGDLGNAGGDADDRAHLPRRELRRERLPRLAYYGKRTVEDTLQAFRRRDH